MPILRNFLFAPLMLFFALTAPVAVVAEQPPLEFTDINGDKLDLEDYRGKWVVVNYWATWCPPCKEEIPELVHFHESNKDDMAVVVGFNMEEKPADELVAFVEENLISYPVVAMSDDMTLIGAIPGMPTTYLLDPSGKPVAMQVGQVTAEMLEQYISSNTSPAAAQ